MVPGRSRGKLLPILTAVLLIIGGVGAAAWYFWPSQSASQTEMARQWIALSDEIIADLPATDGPPLAPPAEGSSELQNRQWAEETARRLQQSQEANSRMTRKYLAQVTETRNEMIQLGIIKDPEAAAPTLWLTNAAEWREWATRLATEGHRVLAATNKPVG